MTLPTNPPRILTFGEAMALFVADAPGKLADIEHFGRRLAGADNNVAIGLARLGFPVSWLSRVGTDSFGDYIQQALEAQGLDCRYLTRNADHATGLMFKERAEDGADPRVAYFRKGSAASRMSTVDADQIDFTGIGHLHATGITPALSDSCRELSRYMMTAARANGATVSFDPNLRPSLWSSEADMCNTLNALASQADWVLPGLSEGQRLTGLTTPYDIAGFYLDLGCKAVFLKLGPEGSYYRGRLTGNDEHCTVAGIPVAKVVDTVGAGDGFAVGVISALLERLTPQEAAHRGNLIGAEAVQVIGDMEGLPDRKRLEALPQHTDMPT